MNKKQVFRWGVEYGMEAAVAAVRECVSGRIACSRDKLAEEAFDNEQHGRQYAGHPVYDINREAGGKPDWWFEEMHDTLDRGVSRGIEKVLSRHFRSRRRSRR